ncbi:MAG: TetR/AcrR family transcriptional regulator [Pseudomonadota bacterium]
MPETSVEVRKGRKFDQVIEGASQIFMTEGFERASVDEIARQAGVSKATLYSYFPDKRLLFVEVMKRECERLAVQADDIADKTRPPEQVLPLVGKILVDFLLSDIGKQSFRMSIAESANFEELGKRFFEAGPGLIERELIAYLEAAEDRGEVRIEDKTLAAHQFAELCKAWIFPRAMLLGERDISGSERRHVVDEAVKMFMVRYAL